MKRLNRWIVSSDDQPWKIEFLSSITMRTTGAQITWFYSALMGYSWSAQMPTEPPNCGACQWVRRYWHWQGAIWILLDLPWMTPTLLWVIRNQKIWVYVLLIDKLITFAKVRVIRPLLTDACWTYLHMEACRLSLGFKGNWIWHKITIQCEKREKPGLGPFIVGGSFGRASNLSHIVASMKQPKELATSFTWVSSSIISG